MNKTLKYMAAAVCILGCLSVSACGDAAIPSTAETEANAVQLEEITETAAPEITPEPVFTAEIGSVTVSTDDSELCFDGINSDDLSALIEISGELQQLEKITIGSALTFEQFDAIKEAFPNAELSCKLLVLEQVCDSDAEVLVLPAEFDPETGLEELEKAIEVLPNLNRVDAISDLPEGESRPVTQLLAVKEILPEGVELKCSFELFGVEVNSEMEEIIYEKAGLGNDDVEFLKTVLPLLSSCRRFVLDNCGPSYETLAALRDEFPERGIVWRVHFKNDSLLTDEHVLWTVYLDNSNCHVLNYCTELEYIDLGHDDALSDISFTAYMPHLKVLIVAITGVRDISPLANCPELEYLELFRTEVTDISPLAACTNLQHLNISTLKITDITPLYGLTNLQRLWMLNAYYVPQSQIDELATYLPDTEMCLRMHDGDLTGHGWRRFPDGTLHERYALLREQIGYGNYNSPADKLDMSKAWKRGYA